MGIDWHDWLSGGAMSSSNPSQGQETPIEGRQDPALSTAYEGMCRSSLFGRWS